MVGTSILGSWRSPIEKITIQQRATRRGTRGYKGRQDPPKGGRTIQQRETRGYNGQRETKGDKTLGKAGRPSNKGNKGKQEGVQSRTRGDKTPEKVDTPSNKKKQKGVQWAMGDKGRQDPRGGGHTSQQGKTRRGTMGDNRRQHPR